MQKIFLKKTLSNLKMLPAEPGREVKMARCCICSTKISSNAESMCLSEIHPDFILCITCYNMKLKLNSSDKTEQITSISYFRDKLKEGLHDPASIKTLQSILNKCDPKSDKAKAEPAKPEEEKNSTIKEYNERMQNFMSTTTDAFEGYTVQKYLGILSGDIPYDADPVSEKDSYSSKLMDARADALKRLKLKCVKKGANAAVGVSIETITPSPNTVIVIASGTAVLIEKKES